MKASRKQKTAEYTCKTKETVGIDILTTSWNVGKKNRVT